MYDECREGEEVADAGDEGRNTAKNSKVIDKMRGISRTFDTHLYHLELS